MLNKITRVSIIMPIYNDSKYIHKSIESILNQTYKDFELILVDDGSSDDSLDICYAYAKRDNRVVVLHKENGGVSSARNAGIMKSSGEYLRFVDADDILPNDSLQRLMAPVLTNRNIDLVVGRFESNDTAIYQGNDIYGLKNCEEFQRHFMLYMRSFYYGVVWNKLYRYDIIRKNDIQFDELINWSEDFFFNMQYYQYSKAFYYVNDTVYRYCRRENSLSEISLHYSEKELLDLEIMRFEAIKNYVNLCCNTGENQGRAYDFMLFKINENFKKVFDLYDVNMRKKYEKFVTVICDDRIKTLIKAYTMRNDSFVYRLMIWSIKKQHRKFLFMLYFVKSKIKSNQKVSKNIEGQNLTPKFPL